MGLGVVGFGTAIPLLTRLYADLVPPALRFWIGYVWFVSLAGAIWLGNRWLLFKQREHFDWFASPWRKLGMLVTANVLYTAPLTVGWLLVWYRFTGRTADYTAIQVVVLTNVICVLFVTHAYETAFLIKERESDITRVERLERSRVEAELHALKAQVDPHFLFNSLNTLGHMITRDAAQGRLFCDTLAEVYRYVLASRARDLVSLAEELEFVRGYARLIGLRFGDSFVLDLHHSLNAAVADGPCMVPPLALQTLLENAVKHNQLGDGALLEVSFAFDDNSVRVTNIVRARTSLRAGAGVGLRNLNERCRLLTGRSLSVDHTAERFEVRVPVVSNAQAFSDLLPASTSTVAPV